MAYACFMHHVILQTNHKMRLFKLFRGSAHGTVDHNGPTFGFSRVRQPPITHVYAIVVLNDVLSRVINGFIPTTLPLIFSPASSPIFTFCRSVASRMTDG